MKLSNIANVVDVEHDKSRLIEIGLTTVSLDKRQVLQTFCLPITPDFDLSPEISQLTGWTTAKLRKQGIAKDEATRRLIAYGFSNRLLISDASDEIPFLEKELTSKFSQHRLNVSILFSLTTGK